MSAFNDEEKKIISEEINKYKTEINNILIEIGKTTLVGDKINLYQKILNLDNTKEDYVLNYLLCLEKTVGKEETEKKYFRKELNRLQICISDKKYNQYFKEYPRKNARQKFLDFINLIKDSSIQNDKDKSIIISKIIVLLSEINDTKFINKKKITWENEELYLNSLYKLLIFSVSYLIIYYNKVKLDSKLSNDPEYIKITTNLKNAQNANNENDISFFNLCLINFLLFHSDFFKYIMKIQKFLIDVDQKFKEKFGKLELCNDEDKSMFEDYINFLATYKFDNRNYNTFWEETFISLTLEEKNEILKTDLYDIKCELFEKGNKLKIYDDNNSFTIDTNKYNLKNFIHDASETEIKKFYWYLNKYMKPNFYKEKLFVCQTKKYWKKLLIDIFQSEAYKEVRNSLFEQRQVDFFLVDDIIKDIIDNIKFFIYNTTFLGYTNNYTNSIYEYGNVNLEIENESVALLIFYGFHIIINIHEIGGHLNVRYQYYISLNDAFHLPDIKEDLRELYTNSAKARNKESGETIEIELFGEVKQSLKIKEALFVLNKDNYSLPSNEFKKKFLNCQNQKLNELINENLKEFLKNLGIDSSNLDENDNNIYKYPLKRKSNETNVYYENKTRHPMSFYYDVPNELEKFFENYHINNS